MKRSCCNCNISGSEANPNGLGTSIATRSGCASAAACMDLASARLRAIRASHNTCFPAASAAQVTSQCRFGHVPIMMASIAGSATRACQFGNCRGIPNSAATFEVDSGVRLMTPTISTPATARKPGMCRRRVLSPAPTMPIRMFDVELDTIRYLTSINPAFGEQ